MVLKCDVRGKTSNHSRVPLPTRDAVSEPKASESRMAKKNENSLRKVENFESLMEEDDWDAHTSDLYTGYLSFFCTYSFSIEFLPFII